MQNEQLHDVYSSSNIIKSNTFESRRMRWVGHVAYMEVKNYKILVRRLEGKRERGRTVRSLCNEEFHNLLYSLKYS
jgi:hypothetical protein